MPLCLWLGRFGLFVVRIRQTSHLAHVVLCWLLVVFMVESDSIAFYHIINIFQHSVLAFYKLENYIKYFIFSIQSIFSCVISFHCLGLFFD